MRLIDADKIGLTDFEIVMCDGDYKKALKMLLNKIDNAPIIEQQQIPRNDLPPAQSEPSQVARDIATIIENEKDMRVMLQQPKWIPCSKPPTENGPYLVWMPFAPEGHHITVTKWCGSYWNIKTPITVYMPLSKPWEGDRNE